ncbi:MAG: outer membrane beta-barrel protein [Chthoniobacterales bacterium]
MRSLNLSALATAAFATILCLQPATAKAGGEGFSKDDLGGGKETIDTKSYDLGEGKFKANPFHISVSLRGGYDDNVNQTDFDQQESWFTSLSAELTYNAGSPRTQIRLTAGGGVTYYWDQSSSAFNDNRDYDVNAYLALAIVHKASPRLTLGANVYASYQTQPNFDTFSNGGVGFNRTNQNFFYSLDKFTLGYLWAPRFATATSYTLGVIDYQNDIVSMYQDRFEHTFGNEFRFLLTPTTTLVGEYRFGIVDYTDTVGDLRDSTSHYLLAGFDHSFSPRFNISARGGVEFRMFSDNSPQQDLTDPYGELTLAYAISKGTQINWTSRYSLEAPDIPEAFTSETFRTALSIRHAFTSRITGGVNLAYEHINNVGALGFSDFTEDDFDITLMLRYAINRTWAIDAGYEFTEVTSPDSLSRQFTRNRGWAGVTFTW